MHFIAETHFIQLCNEYHFAYLLLCDKFLLLTNSANKTINKIRVKWGNKLPTAQLFYFYKYFS